jgi:hypothetical protein
VVHAVPRKLDQPKKIELPCNPYAQGDSRHEAWGQSLLWEKLTADYLRVSVPELGDLDYLLYLTARRDAYIAALMRTPEGVDYLNEAARLATTEPDREASRALFGGRTVDGR